MIKNRAKILLSLFIVLLSIQVAGAQESTTNPSEKETKYKRAWEFGLGGSALQMTRFSVIDAYLREDGGYSVNTDKRDVLFGGNIYIARELNRYFYLDFQGTYAHTNDPVNGGDESRNLYMGGLGLQWRLGEYFKSKYIDPFFRVGVNYMYKDFDLYYNGIEELDDKNIKWNMNNDYNKEGVNRNNLIPISMGAGVNMWLNDHWGIGIQGDYLAMPYKNVANSWEGTVRLIWRIGGNSKRPQPQYVERVVEKIVERPVVVEKVVREPSKTITLNDLFENVYFAFDKADLTSESETIVDQIAEIMKRDTNKRYLITGYTDARGSFIYNMNLSKRRAKTVVDALISRGVSAEIVKFRAVGKKIAYASSSASNEVRRGDRKITVEIISNMDYWNYIP